jgi:hypothetical protein
MKVTNKTIFLTYQAGQSSTTANVFINHPVEKIIFRSLACNSNVTEYAVLQSDMILNETIGVAYRDSSYSNSTAQTIEYHFTSPVGISGNYTFYLKNLDGTPTSPAGDEFYVFVAEFIGSSSDIHA